MFNSFTTQSRLLTTLDSSLLKTLWEKEKMLVTRIFSSSHSVSALHKVNFSFRVTFILSPANAINLDKAKILTFGKELSLFCTMMTFEAPEKNTV